MNGKQAIIDKILKDGNDLAASFIEEARKKADYEVKKARTYAQDYQKKIHQKIEKEKKAIIYRRESQAKIEVKKKILQTKQQIIGQIFSEVANDIKKDTSRYKEFLTKLIESYSEDGDTVVLSDDSTVISSEEVQKIAERKKINLKYKKGNQSFDGVILQSKSFDKNLTLNLLLEQLRQKHIAEITQILFGEGSV